MSKVTHCYVLGTNPKLRVLGIKEHYSMKLGHNHDTSRFTDLLELL